MWLVTPTQVRGNQPCVTTLPSLIVMGLPSSSWVKNPPGNAGDPGSIPGSGRFPGKGNCNLLQYSCLGNPMDWGACWGTAHGVARVRGDLVTKPPPPLSWGHKGINTTEQLSTCTHTHTRTYTHTFSYHFQSAAHPFYHQLSIHMFYNGCIVLQLYKLLNNSLGNQNLCSSQNTLKRNLEDQPLKN